MHGQINKNKIPINNQAPTRTLKCLKRGKTQEPSEKKLSGTHSTKRSTNHEQLQQISLTKSLKLSNGYVLETLAPVSNRFFESFLLDYHQICKLICHPQDQVSLVTSRPLGDLGLLSNNSQHQQTLKTLKITLCVMDLISSHSN